MQDLRLVAANESATHLVLRSQVGEKYLLAIDERLRAAVRGDRARLGQLEIETDGQLRPRDIQAQIRAGATAEQVANAAGVPVDRVRRFEGPVLAEREHMAQMAQRGAVRRPGQADARGMTLGEAVAARLDPLKIKPEELGWDSWRRDDGRWLVQLSYEHDDEDRLARFVFDFRARTIAPEDEEGRWLVGELEQRPKRAPFVPRLAGAPKPEAVGAAPRQEPAGIPASIRGDHPAGRKLPDAPPRHAPPAVAPAPAARKAKEAPAPAAPAPAPIATTPTAPANAPAAPQTRRPAPTTPKAQPAAASGRLTGSPVDRTAARPPASAPAGRAAVAAPAASLGTGTGTAPVERPRRIPALDFLVPPVPGGPDYASEAGERADVAAPSVRREPGPRPAARRPGIRSDLLGPRTQRRSVLDVPPTTAPAATTAEPDAVEHRRTGTHDARPAAASGSRRRASVPSWDDIMFGTRRRD